MACPSTESTSSPKMMIFRQKIGTTFQSQAKIPKPTQSTLESKAASQFNFITPLTGSCFRDGWGWTGPDALLPNKQISTLAFLKNSEWESLAKCREITRSRGFSHVQSLFWINNKPTKFISDLVFCPRVVATLSTRTTARKKEKRKREWRKKKRRKETEEGGWGGRGEGRDGGWRR